MTFPCESGARNVSPRVATSQSPPHATPLPTPQSIRLLLEQKRRQVPGLQEPVKDPINSLRDRVPSTGEGAAGQEAALRSSP